jgi:N-alpha-acetyltransferase 10/11
MGFRVTKDTAPGFISNRSQSTAPAPNIVFHSRRLSPPQRRGYNQRMPEPPLVEYKPADLRDLPALRQVEQICFGSDAWPLLDLVGVLSIPGVVRIKAVVGERMVAFIAGEAKPWEGSGWITTIGVLPEYRRQGIAKRLIAACEQRMGLPQVKLCVRRSNISAISLYQSLGYRNLEIWPAYYSDKEDALVMIKSG